ncbi:MAG: sugar kinase [Azospirillum sp.]|nr:sugar kinase [Azospirillum sp.]
MTGLRVAALGECMIELYRRPDGAAAVGFGGDTLNTAVYLARLGVPVDYVTALGNDPFSDGMVAAWQSEGIGCARVLRAAGSLPGLYMIETDAAGERRFFYWRDQAPVRNLFGLPGGEALAEALAEYDLLYLSGISLAVLGVEGRRRLGAVLERLRARGGRIAFDTNWRPRLWPDAGTARAAYGEMLGLTDIALASQGDERDLYGDDSSAAVMARLAGQGVAEAVVKLDRPGCIVAALDLEPELVLPEQVVQPVDTTAAGDSFSAGYLAARLGGAGPVAAARAGHALAGAVVQHRGALIPSAAMPDLARFRLPFGARS